MNALLRLIKLLWRGLCFVRDLVMNLFFILFVLLGLTVAGLFLQSSGSTTTVKEGALLLNLDGYLADNRPQNSLLSALRALDNRQIPQQISTFDVVDAIQYAAQDPRISGIVLDLNYFSGGDMPSLQFVGKALTEFKAQNKPVYAIAHNYSQSQYLLASYADHIYLGNLGEVSIVGLAQNNLYFKSLIEKLDITPHIFRVGTYKAAVEPFMRDDMSAEARANTRLWLNKMWQNYQQIVAENRQIEQSAVLPDAKTFLAQLKALNGNSTKYAEQRGLINNALSDWQIRERLIEQFGRDDSQADYQYTLFNDYVATLPSRTQADMNQDKIAVINVEGEIIDGVSDDGSAGGDSIAALLQNALYDRNVKAVILRVNSPGGSVMASELIRQQLNEIRANNIPIVVSMGGLAASGGYWISVEADRIIASPNTITGSIGVFAAFFTLENTLKNWGIQQDGVSTGPLTAFSATQSLSPELNQYIQMGVEHSYDQFLNLVAEARNLSKTQADQIAQGQVWLGDEALKHRLVDELGDFDSAVNAALQLVNEKRQAAGEAELTTLPLQWFVEEEQDIFSRFLKRTQATVLHNLQSAVYNLLGITPQQAKQVKGQLGSLQHLNDPRGQYIYCLDCGIRY
ncbi:protease-4 [Pasteurella testudinis DSM 23072]|uniref:Protease-4 n=1 Tax=Pasteurella testudinis DSM 23072 TaxID=1122938 RepID=A0A1W1UKT6_9PAST|nr:signal peptide peptidase SppA [Pasteurella testudinis]SMB81354.1 protease-4 [Pasteurella testudinis DSM 23072]SUB51381.1 protease 4 [Pasteurella testudinis]